MKLATRRLIDASATLPAADRALLSLWTQRGLDDTAMAQMTGVDPVTIAERRDRIVADLSAELGLPPHDVAGALSAIALSAAEALAGDGTSGPGAPGLANGSPATVAAAPAPDPADPVLTAISGSPPPDRATDDGGQAQAEIEPEAPGPQSRPELESLSPPRRRGRLAGLAVALAGVAVAVIVVVAATSGGGAAHRASATNATVVPGAASTSVTSSSSSSGSTSATTPAAPATNPRTLTPLPGGVAGATGAVTLAPGPAGTQRLLVHVSGLPPAGNGYYEVWLYNSIIDSVPLGRLGQNGTGSFTLPAVVARFASIDISRQPAGSIEPSGASLLRTPNPLRAAPH